MKLNLAPFVDLFSILAIGLFLLMVVTTGTDKPEPDASDIIVVKLVPVLSGESQVIGNRRSFQALIRIEPYYLRSGVEIARGDLPVLAVTRQEPDRVEVMIRGRTEELGVGFRVAEIRDMEVLYNEIDMDIVRIRPEHGATVCDTGTWRCTGLTGTSCLCWTDTFTMNPIVRLTY